MIEKSHYILIFAILIICSCGSSDARILTDDEAADLLLDLTISDQVVNLHQSHERDSIRALLTQNLLLIHEIDRSELDTNIYLYMSDYEKFARINDIVFLKYDSIQQTNK